MNLRPYDDADGRKVWLSSDEVDALLQEARDHDTDHYLALALAVRSGLRSAEVVEVRPDDVVATDAGDMVRVREEGAKGDKYRETPCPPSLAETLRTVADVRDSSGPFVDVETRTLRRWVTRHAETLEDRTGDSGWSYLGMHDLRRTWATALASADVDALLVLDWGGWEDLETFLDHYRGTYSPDAQRREREKVNWL